MKKVLSLLVLNLLSHICNSQLSRSALRQALGRDPVHSHRRDGIPEPQNVNLADFLDIGVALPDMVGGQASSNMAPMNQPPFPNSGIMDNRMQSAMTVSDRQSQVIAPGDRFSGQTMSSGPVDNTPRRQPQPSSRQRPRNRQQTGNGQSPRRNVNRPPRVNTRGGNRNRNQNSPERQPTRETPRAGGRNSNSVQTPSRQPSQTGGTGQCPFEDPTFSSVDSSMTQRDFDQRLRQALQAFVQGCTAWEWRIYIHWLLRERQRLFNI